VAKFFYETDPKSKKSEETHLKKYIKNFNTKNISFLLVQKQIKLASVNHYLLITNVDKYLRAVYNNQKK